MVKVTMKFLQCRYLSCTLISQRPPAVHKGGWEDKRLSGVMARCLVHWTLSHWVLVRCSRRKFVFPFVLSLSPVSINVIQGEKFSSAPRVFSHKHDERCCLIDATLILFDLSVCPFQIDCMPLSLDFTWLVL